MGGTIAGHYALAHTEQIEGLILMSAVGVSSRPAHMTNEALVNERQSYVSKFGATWVLNNWSTNTFSPADFYRMAGYRVAKRFVR